MSTLNLCLALGLVILVGHASRGQNIPQWVTDLPQSCNSGIYCYGDLLKTVQLAGLYNDSKTFVDLKCKFPETNILANFNILQQSSNGNPSNEDLRRFVSDNFEDGNELENHLPSDWVARPSLVDKIRAREFQQWVMDLNSINANLSRKVKDDVRINPELYSLIWVPYVVVIPGGRFDEVYYWDTYWIVHGLLLCDMVDTARGVIENLLYLLRKYGHVLNGSRKYYMERSQPPLLTRMVNLYYSFTKDLSFVKKYISLLEKEYKYWLDKQSVKISKDGVTHVLFRYIAPSQGPRPESYREDYATASTFVSEADKARSYIDLKSAAESGQDFSTRWMITKDGSNIGDLTDISTPHIVPVDLNSFMHYNMKSISFYYKMFGNDNKAAYYQSQADQLLCAIENVLYIPSLGIWLDYDLRNKRSRNYFYVSNLTPLWTESYRESKQFLTRSVLNYLAKYNIPKYNGIPTSLYNSGQQWDFPNGWSPYQCIVIEGLRHLGTKEAICAARHYALKWLNTNYVGWTKYKKMFEKYDVLLLGETGAGGEYEAQTGFGWTNGCDLSLLDWLHDITVHDVTSGSENYNCPY